MIEIRTNTQQVISDVSSQLGILMNPQELMKLAAVAVLPVIKKRVHEDGKDSTGKQIGNYSPGYMKVRTGVFGNSGKYVKGKNKGEVKDTGVFSKGKHKGSPRPKYNRTNDTKIIGSLTRQMENGMVVVPTDNGSAIGYTNQHDLDKAIWLDETYGYAKKGVRGNTGILTHLTEEETNIARDAVDNFVTKVVTQINQV